MLSTYYAAYRFSRVVDVNNFYNSGTVDVGKIKSLVGVAQIIFSLNPNRVCIDVAEGERVYRIILLDSHKNPFGWFIYMPVDNRIDLFLADSPGMPFIQWKNKKAVFKNYPKLLDAAGLDKLFTRLVNVS